MADSQIAVTEGSGKNVDTRTNAGGDHRQVVVLGHESATDSIAAVQATDPSSSALGLVVRDPYSTTIVSGLDSVRVRNLIDGTLSTVSAVTAITNALPAGTNDLGNIIRVKNLVDGTLSTVSAVTSITNALPTGSNDLGNIVRVKNLVDGTLSTVSAVTAITNALPAGTNDLGNIIRVKNIVDGTLSTVTGVDRVRNVVDGTLTTITGLDRVRNVVDGTLATVVRVTNLVDGTVKLSSSSASMAVYFDRGNPAVNNYFAGNVAVTPNAGIPAVNVYSTTSIFTVSGSTSGGTTSGVTLVAPSANYNFKVFAYSLQTTGIVSEAWRFTNGAASETELWRPLITAANTTSAPVGANLAVQPPGFIFATGTNTTLALKSSTGSLVHYSVSYIKESA